MARASNTDYLHNMRFHVEVKGPDNNVWLNSAGDNLTGFQTVSIPDMSIDSVDYKEGIWVYGRKYPGNPTPGGDISMNRGVTRDDNSFWHWARCAIEGSGEYRADIDIKHFHRDQVLTRPVDEPGGTTANLTAFKPNLPAKIYHVHECFPLTCKPAGDMDATSSDISISELTATYEYFDVETFAATA